MPMPATRKGKSKSVENQANLRKSPRKRNIPEAIEVTDKTPKRTRRKSVPKSFDAEFSDFFNTPSTSKSDNGKVCSFYRMGSTPNGVPTFSKSLIKYFMKVDSPEMEDLRLKRFNTSFRREIPRNRDSLKIFTEEEDNDKKWLENVPDLESNFPEIPGTEHADVFASIPLLNIDSDEEFKIKPTGKNKKRKSVRCTEFKGKPLPDQSLMVDYSSVLDFESSWDAAENDEEENKDAVKNNNGILYSLLSSPSNKPITQGKSDNLLRTKEDERLLSKYKDIISDKRVNVVLTRLPIDSHLSQLSEKERVTAKSAIDFGEKKRVSKVKKDVNGKIKVSKSGLSKCQKKKNGNAKSKV